MLRVRWTCSSREEDAEGNVLRKHGDTGVFEDDRARTHERMRRCEVIGEVVEEPPEPEPEPIEDLDEDEQQDDEVTDATD